MRIWYVELKLVLLRIPSTTQITLPMTDRLVETPAILVWESETVQLGDGLLRLTVPTLTWSENYGDLTSLDGPYTALFAQVLLCNLALSSSRHFSFQVIELFFVRCSFAISSLFSDALVWMVDPSSSSWCALSETQTTLGTGHFRVFSFPGWPIPVLHTGAPWWMMSGWVNAPLAIL